MIYAKKKNFHNSGSIFFCIFASVNLVSGTKSVAYPETEFHIIIAGVGYKENKQHAYCVLNVSRFRCSF